MGWNWQCAVGVYREGGLEGKSAMIEKKYIILRTTCLRPVTLTPFEVDICGGIFSSCGLCTRFRHGEAKGLRCEPLDLKVDGLFLLSRRILAEKLGFLALGQQSNAMDFL
jgi:hypothetical protein